MPGSGPVLATTARTHRTNSPACRISGGAGSGGPSRDTEEDHRRHSVRAARDRHRARTGRARPGSAETDAPQADVHRHADEPEEPESRTGHGKAQGPRLRAEGDGPPVRQEEGDI